MKYTTSSARQDRAEELFPNLAVHLDYQPEERMTSEYQTSTYQLNQIDPEAGEIVESYAESRELFTSKAVACVAYAKEEAAALVAAAAMLHPVSRL